MSSDETMRLVATVVDGYSGPLKEMMNALKKISEGSKDIHAKGKKDVVDHTKTYRELGEQIRKVKDNGVNILTPSLAAMGVTVYGLSEGMGKLVETLRGAGERWNVLNETTKRGGVTPAYVNAIGRAFERMGMDAGKADAAVGSIGESLDKLKAHDPQEMNRLTGVYQDLLPFLDKITKGAKDREEEMTRIAGAVTDEKFPIWKRRKLAEAFGIDPALASRTGAEFGKALRESMQRELDHKVDPKTLEGLRDAFTHLRAAQRDYGDDMVSIFGAPGIRLVDGFASALDGLGKKYREQFGGHGTVPLHPDSLFGRAASALGFKTKEPESANGRVSGAFDALTKKEQQETVARGTTQGVLDAFRQWMSSQSEAQKFADGLRPIAYHPANDAAGGAPAPRFGSKMFPNINDAGGPFSKTQRDAISGGGAPDGAGSGPTSGSLAEQRKRFAQELQNNPGLRDKVLRIAANEQGRHPEGTQSVLETMMNRAIVRKTSLEQQARWHRSEGGYYDEGNMGRGALENAKSRAVLENSLRNTLNGGNLSNYATDNSSGSLAARERATGKFRYRKDFNGETFFAPGSAEKGLSKRWDAWHEQVVAADQIGRGARLRDMVRRGHHAPSDAELLKLGRRGDAGGADGKLGVRIDLNGFPKGTRTAVSQEGGLLKEVALHRGRTMVRASEES